MITMKIFGAQVGNRSRIFFSNITQLLTAKHEQDTAVNSFACRRDAMAVFPKGVRKSMILPCFTSCAHQARIVVYEKYYR